MAVYAIFSEARLDANPHDKLLPSFTQMIDAIDRLAFTEDVRKGRYLFWSDTISSLSRLFLGVAGSNLKTDYYINPHCSNFTTAEK